MLASVFTFELLKCSCWPSSKYSSQRMLMPVCWCIELKDLPVYLNSIGNDVSIGYGKILLKSIRCALFLVMTGHNGTCTTTSNHQKGECYMLSSTLSDNNTAWPTFKCKRNCYHYKTKNTLNSLVHLLLLFYFFIFIFFPPTFIFSLFCRLSLFCHLSFLFKLGPFL